MQVPVEFQKMAEYFHQDIFVISESRADLAEWVLAGFSESERQGLKSFLSEIVSSRYSDEQLLNLWDGMPAEIWFGDAREFRELLVFIRDQIE